MNGNERIRRTEVTPSHVESYEDKVKVAVVGAVPVGLTAAAMLATWIPESWEGVSTEDSENGWKTTFQNHETLRIALSRVPEEWFSRASL